MRKNRKSIGSDLRRLDRHKVTAAELREAPPLTAAQLERAVIRDGGKVVRRGRPRSDNPKQAVKLRIDGDVLSKFRKTGAGWQTRINETLRRAAARMK